MKFTLDAMVAMAPLFTPVGGTPDEPEEVRLRLLRLVRTYGSLEVANTTGYSTSQWFEFDNMRDADMARGAY